MKSLSEFHLSKNDKMICGVCAGIAEFVGVPSWVIRVLVVLLLMWGVDYVVITYLILAFLVPER